MRKLYVIDEEEARLRRITLAVTADLEDQARAAKARSDSRLAALARLDRARVQRQIDDGSPALKGGAVVLK